MNLLPQNAQEIEVVGATVPFYKYEENGVTFIQFDSSKAGHPEPMINAMSGLQTIQGDEKLIMLNSKPPMGLFPKIENEFDFEHEEIKPGLTRVVFSKKGQNTTDTNFNDTTCGGGSCSN
ncbi:MAG TPA: hypothetical protein EYG97_01340 [Arcobacter sp.]|nr:hypothetical protein [Arcobacter sp.]HIP55649.1 hypothetical protein [Arcobacter sp.]